MDLPGRKESFCSAPSGWRIACTCIGRDDEARELFERLLALRNDVGLLAEEYDPRAKRSWGIFRRPSRTSRW